MSPSWMGPQPLGGPPLPRVIRRRSRGPWPREATVSPPTTKGAPRFQPTRHRHYRCGHPGSEPNHADVPEVFNRVAAKLAERMRAADGSSTPGTIVETPVPAPWAERHHVYQEAIA